jgi:hypothetical protein
LVVGLGVGVGWDVGVTVGVGVGGLAVIVAVGVGLVEVCSEGEGLGSGDEVAWAPTQGLNGQLTTAKSGCAASASAAAVNCAHIGAQ